MIWRVYLRLVKHKRTADTIAMTINGGQSCKISRYMGEQCYDV